MESVIPASKIAMLSSCEFVGIVADSPDSKIKQKTLPAEIQNDYDSIRREVQAISIIEQVTAEDVREL